MVGLKLIARGNWRNVGVIGNLIWRKRKKIKNMHVHVLKKKYIHIYISYTIPVISRNSYIKVIIIRQEHCK